MIVSKDTGFAALRLPAGAGPAVVWVRSGGVTNDAMIKALAAALRDIVGASGEGVAEVG